MTRPGILKAHSPAPQLAKVLAWRPSAVQAKLASPFLATPATHVARAIQLKPAPPQVLQSAALAATAAPSATIDWADLRAKAEEEGCQFQSNGLGDFLGPTGATSYPHLHVWANGDIALSWAHGRNTRVGRNGVVDIAALGAAADRARLGAGPLKSAIQWVMASAS